jgi:hypothetical protein
MVIFFSLNKPMPVISYFFGIYVRMYFADHAPPHFHVEYQGHEALIAIESGDVIEGRLPGKAARLIKEWCQEHRTELLANWQKGQDLEPMQRIAGADND